MRSIRSILGIAVWLAIGISVHAQTGVPEGISLFTEMRVRDTTGWWPTKGSAPRDQYVGSAECAKCHASKAASYAKAAMSHAAVPANESESLRQHNPIGLDVGPFHYRIETTESGSTLRVNDDKSSVASHLAWAVGIGHMGQTYLYEEKGGYYESHLSFYSQVAALDITPGQPRDVPQSLEAAPGRRMPDDETRRCFGCHTTASTTNNKFDPTNLFPGVTCEACHGPGSGHVAAAKSGIEGFAASLILNPAKFNRDDAVDFCGACHRTWEDVVGNGQTALGVFNVRFAPYRLENSKCWKKGDARITCTACHDPHEPLSHDAASYDSACLQCHVSTVTNAPAKGKKHSRGTPACPVATSNCVSCHMPKYEPPTLHSSFTDHWIRVVPAGSRYPE